VDEGAGAAGGVPIGEELYGRDWGLIAGKGKSLKQTLYS
jgi:hypothetical protein